MKFRKTLIVSLFLLSLLMIGAVSASNDSDTIVSNDITDDTNTHTEIMKNKIQWIL